MTGNITWNGHPAWTSWPKDGYPVKPHVEAVRYNYGQVTIMIVIEGHYTGHEITPDQADELADQLHVMAEDARKDPE